LAIPGTSRGRVAHSLSSRCSISSGALFVCLLIGDAFVHRVDFVAYAAQSAFATSGGAKLDRRFALVGRCDPQDIQHTHLLFVAWGVLFHPANAFGIGLNSLFWALMATYPPLLYAAATFQRYLFHR
jgi:hypothetical protein